LQTLAIDRTAAVKKWPGMPSSASEVVLSTRVWMSGV
jgi:hypothetical protein